MSQHQKPELTNASFRLRAVCWHDSLRTSITDAIKTRGISNRSLMMAIVLRCNDLRRDIHTLLLSSLNISILPVRDNCQQHDQYGEEPSFHHRSAKVGIISETNKNNWKKLFRFLPVSTKFNIFAAENELRTKPYSSTSR